MKKCVYGLGDASKIWYLSIKEKLEELKVKCCKSAPTLFVSHENNKLQGIICTHVDDFIFGRDKLFNEQIRNIKKITIGIESEITFVYLGLNIQQYQNYSISVDQISYNNNVEYVEMDAKRKADKSDMVTNIEPKKYRTLIGQLNWIACQTKPDLSFDHCEISSVANKAKVSDLIKANKVLSKAKSNHVKLYCLPIDIFNMAIVIYNDSLFGNLSGDGSQGGFITYLVDNQENCMPLMWQSKRLKCVVKSAMAAETLIQVEAAEAGFWISNIITEIYNLKQNVLAECRTDSCRLYDAVHSIRAITDKRLRIDIALLQEMLLKKKISRTKWIASHEQIADCLTKQEASSNNLISTLQDAKLKLIK